MSPLFFEQLVEMPPVDVEKQSPVVQAGESWVDERLLSGADGEPVLRFGETWVRRDLRNAVLTSQRNLVDAGLVVGGSVALQLPPSSSFLTNLLAAWRIGAQVTLLDHRLAPGEVEKALDRVGAEVVVSTQSRVIPLRGYQDVHERVSARDGRKAESDHAVLQLSSGSTGPSKVIGRTVPDLLCEVERYRRIDGVPRPGERVVLLASMPHVLGLVGGLLYCLHENVLLDVPHRITADSVLETIAADSTATTVIGVPHHIGLLAALQDPPHLPQFARMTTGGELVSQPVVDRFTRRYSAVLANMYGMTEVGVIATDLGGDLLPALRAAPGMDLAVVDGELRIAVPRSPYVGLSDPTRWSDGWLRTRDAAAFDPRTELLTVLGRLDSQVSIGGLKVDLMEVEEVLAGLDAVTEAVVVFDGSVEAYVALRSGCSVEAVEGAVVPLLAQYKRPRQWHVVSRLPRTATGKVVRDIAALRAVVREDTRVPS